MSGFDGYDQWKTASPYEDDYDPIDWAEKELKKIKDEEIKYGMRKSQLTKSWQIIDKLCEFIQEMR